MQKIMFTKGLTRAVLEGRKTMTRRTITGITPEDSEYLETAFDWDLRESVIIDRYARYKPSEVVAVAQSYKDAGVLFIPCTDPQWGYTRDMPGYNNKMFVRADLMPHQIQITGCHVERLQDISDEDCLREGVRKLESEGNPTMFTFDGWKFKNKVNRCADSPKEAFAALIQKMHGKKAWDDNPWVFAYDFTRIK